MNNLTREKKFDGQPVFMADVSAAGGFFLTGLLKDGQVTFRTLDGRIISVPVNDEWKPSHHADFEPLRVHRVW